MLGESLSTLFSVLQLESPGYKAFLEYMCPDHARKGVFPPYGTDPAYCPRPILGIYDDHDFGWNNGDKRFVQLFFVRLCHCCSTLTARTLYCVGFPRNIFSKICFWTLLEIFQTVQEEDSRMEFNPTTHSILRTLEIP